VLISGMDPRGDGNLFDIEGTETTQSRDLSGLRFQNRWSCLFFFFPQEISSEPRSVSVHKPDIARVEKSHNNCPRELVCEL
jgi:hypothetical protein